MFLPYEYDRGKEQMKGRKLPVWSTLLKKLQTQNDGFITQKK